MQKLTSLCTGTAILISLLMISATAAEPLARFTVAAGDHGRLDTPVSVDLSGVPLGFAGDQYRLLEVTGGKNVDVPVQLEAGSPPRIWWVLSGKTPAGKERTYELHAGASRAITGVTTEKDDKVLLIKQGQTKVLSYNHAIVPPPPLVQMGEKYKDTRYLYHRSGFIHPLWSPSGSVLTGIHPPDHYHHLGLWMPWTHTRFKGKLIDFWNLGSGLGTVRFTRILSKTSGPVFGGFQIEHDHVVLNDPKDDSDDVIALKEVWDVRVYNIGGPDKGYWLWDLVSAQRCVADSPLLLEAYRYGGWGYRATADWKGATAAYLTSEGKSREDGHSTTARWCDTSGVSDGQWKGMTFFSNPHNLKHPEHMRIWPGYDQEVFFNWMPYQAEEMEMKPGEDFVYRYRQYVHEGKVNVDRTEQVWNDYAHPPKVEMGMVNAGAAVELFDGGNVNEHWKRESGPGEIGWAVEGDTMTIVKGGGGSIVTKKNYSDFKMHLEFRTPQMPANVTGQARANSGVYIQKRYELQILDSYGQEPKKNECASIYTRKAPDKNVCSMPERWQSYDIIFHAAQYGGDTKVKNARITVWHNGELVHNDYEIPDKTGAGQKEGPEPGPIKLQDHGNAVSFRNIWIEEL